MDQEIILKAVREAAREVFSTMLDLEIAAGLPYIEENRQAEQPPDSEGVMALTGMAGSWVGTGTLVCSPAFACRAASIMLLGDFKQVDEEVLDAIAEISNMIFGNVKTALEEYLGPLGLSIPNVIFGKHFSMRSVGRQMWTILPFTVGSDRIQVRIFLTPNQSQATHLRQGLPRSYAVQSESTDRA